MKISIVVKIVLCAFLVLAASLGFLGWYFIRYETGFMEREINERITALVNNLVRENEQYILTGDDEKLTGLAGEIIRRKDITVAHIKDASGKIIALAERYNEGPTRQIIVPIEISRKAEGNATPAQPDNNGRAAGRVEVLYSLNSFNQMVSDLQTAVILMVLIILVLSTGLAYYFAHLIIVAPLKELAAGARKIEQGDFGDKIKLQSNDEMGVLAETFNKISDNLKWSRDQVKEYSQSLEQKVDEKIKQLKDTNEQLSQSSKMASIGTLSGGIAHDFNNILSAILGNAQVVKLELSPESEQYKLVEAIESSAQKGAELTQKLLSFTRRTRIKTSSVNLNNVVNEVVALLGRTVEKMIRIETRLDPDLYLIEADVTQMYQVILNICINAKEAMMPKDGGRLLIETANKEFSDSDPRPQANMQGGKYAVCSVSDTGIGMEPSQIKHIFEPFYTTKQIGSGVGLGLSMTDSIVREHKGFINVSSRPGSGSRFDIYIMASKTAAQSEPANKAESDIKKGQGTVLAVDDEPAVRYILKSILERFGYIVLMAEDGKKGLEMFDLHKDKIDLVILDLIMPGLSGVETLKRLKQLYPKSKVLISSGYVGVEKNQEILNAGSDGFIYKPYSIRQLVSEVKKIITPEEIPPV